jgi:group I intron endonuclease
MEEKDIIINNLKLFLADYEGKPIAKVILPTIELKPYQLRKLFGNYENLLSAVGLTLDDKTKYKSKEEMTNSLIEFLKDYKGSMESEYILKGLNTTYPRMHRLFGSYENLLLSAGVIRDNKIRSGTKEELIIKLQELYKENNNKTICRNKINTLFDVNLILSLFGTVNNFKTEAGVAKYGVAKPTDYSVSINIDEYKKLAIWDTEDTNRSFLIYKHTAPNGKSYIGQTNDYVARCYKHQLTDGCPAFYSAIKKYGWDNFTHEILIDGLTLAEANEFEELMISEFNTISPNGYNIKNGGCNFSNAEETKVKLSKVISHKHKHDAEYRNKVLMANSRKQREDGFPWGEEMLRLAVERFDSKVESSNDSKFPKGDYLPINRTATFYYGDREFIFNQGEFAEFFGTTSEGLKKCFDHSRYRGIDLIITPAKGLPDIKFPNIDISILPKDTIIAYDNTTYFIFENGNKASIETGVGSSNIFKCYSGKGDFAHGYKWFRV